jgi:hypothetical protein
MAIRPSPSVNTTEKDFITIVQEVPLAPAAFAGVFHWGPVGQRVILGGEDELRRVFQGPSNFNAEGWFSLANFFAYSGSAWAVRVANTSGTSPVMSVTVDQSNATVVVDNTTNLSVGMSVLTSSNGGIRVGAKIATIVNSTAFTLTSNNDALIDSEDEVQFYTNTAFTAIANSASVSNLVAQIVRNEDHFTGKDISSFDSDVHAVARYPGANGNSLRVSVCSTPEQFTKTINLSSFTSNTTISLPVNSNTATVTIVTTSNTSASANASAFLSNFSVTDKIKFGNSDIGFQYLKITALGNADVTGNGTFGQAVIEIDFDDKFKLSANIELAAANASGANSITRFWEFYNSVDKAPGQSEWYLSHGNSAVTADEMHVVVVDENGQFSDGIPGTVLETFEAVSRATDARAIDGGSNYYKTVINENSNYIWWINDLTTAVSNTGLNLTSASGTIKSFDFVAGNDGKNEQDIEFGVLTAGWDLFKSKEAVTFRYIITGKASDQTLPNYLIDNIAEKRQDCVVFVSPTKGSVVNNVGNEESSIRSFRNNLRSTSYGFLDSGYKYQPDRYNNVNRWIPLNGDIAGLAARTAQTNDEWWSIAGYTRGQIKNITKLAYSPNEDDRDVLYPADVNPVFTDFGLGTILLGDKTLLGRPSHFSRINVRMLFIVLRKAISEMAKFQLFQFNNEFTRSQFRNAVNPYLRDIMGREGITDYVVVCDETNNTAQVIQNYRFIGDIYVKPTPAINWIDLNFNAVGQTVDFSEFTNRVPPGR